MDLAYACAPFLAWLLSGGTKFVINSVKSKQLAFAQIGYGGLPSTHSAIVSSAAALIAIREGIAHPAFGVAATLALVVMLDANSLRLQIGKHARVINKYYRSEKALRESIGHSRTEIIAGVAVGIFAAVLTDSLFSAITFKQ